MHSPSQEYHSQVGDANESEQADVEAGPQRRRNLGWVCVHRTILDHPRSNDLEWFKLWITLLLLATHSKRNVIFGGKQVTLKPGQFITGRKSLSRRTGIDESRVRRLLEKMQTDRQIGRQSSNKNTLVTIVNWNEYQHPDQQKGQQSANSRPHTTMPPSGGIMINGTKAVGEITNAPSSSPALGAPEEGAKKTPDGWEGIR